MEDNEEKTDWFPVYSINNKETSLRLMENKIITPKNTAVIILNDKEVFQLSESQVNSLAYELLKITNERGYVPVERKETLIK